MYTYAANLNQMNHKQPFALHSLEELILMNIHSMQNSIDTNLHPTEFIQKYTQIGIVYKLTDDSNYTK